MEENKDDSIGNQTLKQQHQDATTVDTVGEITEASSQLEDDDSRCDLEKMSPFKYSRISGSISRDDSASSMGPLLNLCTSIQLGRVILPREEEGGQQEQQNKQTMLDSTWQKPHYVIFAGFQNGSMVFVDMESGAAIIPSKKFKLPELSDAAILDVSLDATTTYLAAINARGTCGIWEVRYSRTVSQTSTPQSDVFSFLSTLGGQSTNDESKQGEGCDNKVILKVSSLQGSTISYPASFGRATCLVLDPSYKRRREKLLLVGYEDGKLVLTKRGFLQLRNDAVIYQGTPGASDYRGIEAVTWRGSMVAWADASGIKLFDIESMSRIAHIDRPAGARASLYPTISYIRPTLIFETCDSLLVAWGDCVMCMGIKEITVVIRQQSQQSDVMTALANGSAAPTDVPPTKTKRRQVECNMAWELDCIASGVIPLDKDRLIILGLVPKEDEIEIDSNHLNDLELQVISRSTGTISHADILPITKHSSETGAKESAASYHLLSTFAIPRMENSAEVEEESANNTGAYDQDFMNLFTSSSSTSDFLDSHLRWNLNMLDFDSPGREHLGGDDDDDISTYSDDYDFILREPLPYKITATSQGSSIEVERNSPILVIGGTGDFVCARTLDIDDAISHALSHEKVGLALQRAMRYKRQLRRHNINDIGNEFLKKVLCLRKATDDKPREQNLSIRRLELAAKSTPILLGGNLQRWKYWVNEISRIPGALFVLWNYLPVRDPKLPEELYATILNNLYKEIEDMLSVESSDKKPSPEVTEKAVHNFLRALSAWGPTHALQEKINFHEYIQSRLSKSADILYIEDRKMILERRSTQSAAGYLEFPSRTEKLSTKQSDPTKLKSSSPLIDSTSDSLFDVKNFLPYLSSRLTYLDSSSGNTSSIVSEVPPSLLNTKVAFDAFAELSVMKTDYLTALKCFLLIGHLFAVDSLEQLEEMAIYHVNKGEHKAHDVDRYINYSYGFVIAMIEKHHLHALLLDGDFLDGITSPLISFVQLVGLELAGGFLVEHCMSSPLPSLSGNISTKSPNSKSLDSGTAREGDETLPITLIAKQLQSSPPLLHWYLNLIFQMKPDMYVQFPTTAVPPISITELHRAHLDLYIEFAADKDSALMLREIELYNHERKTTPLFLFLKAALPLGGIQATEVRSLLEEKRIKNLEDFAEFPRVFALELAYVIENYGDKSEEESYQVLDLYLKGAQSVMLAVAYAQRNTEFSNILWEVLIQYCLEDGELNKSEYDEGKIDGTLFGSLLEVAALCGADLALLVSSIPQGMNIEGLRPRLVAAVADYRMKLRMHEASAGTCREDRLSLLREVGHRSRRGMRQRRPTSSLSDHYSKNIMRSSNSDPIDQAKRRPIERPNRYHLSVRLPMR